MRRRCVSRRVSLPLRQTDSTSSTGPENRTASKRKSEDGTKSRAGAISSFVVSHFWVTVISRGQHETGPLEAGFLSLGGTEELPPVWWQFSMSAVSPDWVWPAESSRLEDASTIAGELARAGCVQPMRQARTPIHMHTPVAGPALKIFKDGRISTFVRRRRPPKHSRYHT